MLGPGVVGARAFKFGNLGARGQPVGAQYLDDPLHIFLINGLPTVRQQVASNGGPTFKG